MFRLNYISQFPIGLVELVVHHSVLVFPGSGHFALGIFQAPLNHVGRILAAFLEAGTKGFNRGRTDKHIHIGAFQKPSYRLRRLADRRRALDINDQQNITPRLEPVFDVAPQGSILVAMDRGMFKEQPRRHAPVEFLHGKKMIVPSIHLGTPWRACGAGNGPNHVRVLG